MTSKQSQERKFKKPSDEAAPAAESKVVFSKLLDKVKRSPSFDLTMAVTSLENARIMTAETKDGYTSVKYTYPESLLSVMRGLFPSGRSYLFMIHSSATLQATAGGVISSSINFSPAVTTFAEWSALAALFDEVKLVSSHLTWTTGLTPVATATPTQICLAPDLISNAASTPSYTAVQRLAESREFGMGPFMTSGSSEHAKIRIPLHREFATTATPATTSPPAGCCGAWVWASAVVTTNSTYYAFISLRNVVRLRMRA